MSASRAILLPTGMVMPFSIGRPVAATDPAWRRDDLELQPEPRTPACVVAIRDGKPVEDAC